MNRGSLSLSLTLLLLALACTPGAPSQSTSTTPQPAATPGAVLKSRDTPLPVGSPAPAFAGRPAGNAVIVFYRGHW